VIKTRLRNSKKKKLNDDDDEMGNHMMEIRYSTF